MPTQNLRVDSKGRIMIPNSFREALGIKFGENIEAYLDEKNNRILLFPIEKENMKLTVVFWDSPGVLARAAALLAKHKADLVCTSSRSIKRGREAEWEVVADFSRTNLEKLKNDLRKESRIKRFKFEKLQA